MSHTVEELDEIDKRLLRILQEDAKTPYSKISEEIGVSEATVHMRIKKLIRLGVIRGFQAIIDPQKVGIQASALVSVRIALDRYSNIVDELKRIPEICEIHDIRTDYDLILKVRARNNEHLLSIIDKIAKIPGVHKVKVTYILRTIKESSKVVI